MTRPMLTVIGAVVLASALAGPALLAIRADQGQAAFGAAERLGINRLGSATLDVGLGSTTAPLVIANMAPGDRITGSIEIVNAGTVALRYALVMDSGTSPLSDWLIWEVWPASNCERRPNSTEVLTSPSAPVDPLGLLGNPLTGADPGDRSVDPGERELLCLATTLEIDAPDSAQGLTSRHELVVIAEHDVTASSGGKP